MFTKKNLGLSDSLIEVVKKVVKKEDKDKVEKDIKKGDEDQEGKSRVETEPEEKGEKKSKGKREPIDLNPKLQEGKMSDIALLADQGMSAKKIAKELRLPLRAVEKVLKNYDPDTNLNKQVRLRSLEDEKGLDERELTDAEKKKREEIVLKLKNKKGIGNPYAVATAAAKKESVDEDDQDTDQGKNIIIQLRKVVSLRNNHTGVEFKNGKTLKVPVMTAVKALDKYAALRTSIQKGMFTGKLAKSPESFKAAIRESILDERSRGKRMPGKGIDLECMECGKKFTKQITRQMIDVRCPKCKGYDVEVAEGIKLNELNLTQKVMATIKDKGEPDRHGNSPLPDGNLLKYIEKVHGRQGLKIAKELLKGTHIRFNEELDEWTVSDVEIAMKKEYGKIDKEAIEKLKKVQYKGNVDRNDLVKAGHGKLHVESVELDEKKGQVAAYDKAGKLVGNFPDMKTAKKLKPNHTYKVKEELELDERDYRKEYDEYHAKPIQRERNAARLRARRMMEKIGKVKKFDKMDIHHRDNNPLNNEEENLEVTTQNWNRAEPRLREQFIVKWKKTTPARPGSSPGVDHTDSLKRRPFRSLRDAQKFLVTIEKEGMAGIIVQEDMTEAYGRMDGDWYVLVVQQRDGSREIVAKGSEADMKKAARKHGGLKPGKVFITQSSHGVGDKVLGIGEEAPANAAGSGNVAGIAPGEDPPGKLPLKDKVKKRKKKMDETIKLKEAVKVKVGDMVRVRLHRKGKEYIEPGKVIKVERDGIIVKHKWSNTPSKVKMSDIVEDDNHGINIYVKQISKDIQINEGFTDEKTVAKHIKNELGSAGKRWKRNQLLTTKDVNEFVQDNLDSPHKVDQNEVVKHLKKLGVKVSGPPVRESDEDVNKGEGLNEKFEYAEYQFKSSRDAMSAKKYFDGVQTMDFTINDDNIRGGQLTVDADGDDMTKHHQEVIRIWKPKIVSAEAAVRYGTNWIVKMSTSRPGMDALHYVLAQSAKEAKKKALALADKGSKVIDVMKETEEMAEGREKPARQLVNPNKEVLVVKKNKVVVIDKKDQTKYERQGWQLAEETTDTEIENEPEISENDEKDGYKSLERSIRSIVTKK